MQVDVSPIQLTLAREPKLGIVIPSKNRNDLLFDCINSILQHTQYQNYTIYVADTGSSPEVLAEFKHTYGQHPKIELIKFNYYHFASINNLVIKHMMDADTELILCCNNDIKMLNDAVSLMVNTYLNNQLTVGTVGARLHYEDGSIQHLGINFSGHAVYPLSHAYIGQAFKRSDFHGDIALVFGNTAAFMLMSRNLFLDVGGYNEAYEECYEDAELNLKLAALGKTNLLPFDAVCYHYESKSRREFRKDQYMTQNDHKRLVAFLQRNQEAFNYYFPRHQAKTP